jgi:hypothetical protein
MELMNNPGEALDWAMTIRDANATEFKLINRNSKRLDIHYTEDVTGDLLPPALGIMQAKTFRVNLRHTSAFSLLSQTQEVFLAVDNMTLTFQSNQPMSVFGKQRWLATPLRFVLECVSADDKHGRGFRIVVQPANDIRTLDFEAKSAEEARTCHARCCLASRISCHVGEIVLRVTTAMDATPSDLRDAYSRRSRRS